MPGEPPGAPVIGHAGEAVGVRQQVAELGLAVVGGWPRRQPEPVGEQYRLERPLVGAADVAQAAGEPGLQERMRLAVRRKGDSRSEGLICDITVQPLARDGDEPPLAVRSGVLELESGPLPTERPLIGEFRSGLREVDADLVRAALEVKGADLPFLLLEPLVVQDDPGLL